MVALHQMMIRSGQEIKPLAYATSTLAQPPQGRNWILVFSPKLPAFLLQNPHSYKHRIHRCFNIHLKIIFKGLPMRVTRSIALFPHRP